MVAAAAELLQIMTLGGEDIAIPFPKGRRPLTSGYLVRELAARTPNHPSTFRLWVNDSVCPIEGDATDLTDVVDPTKHITLLYEPCKPFDTSAELRTAVLEWSRGGIAKESVLKTYGHVISSWDVSAVTDTHNPRSILSLTLADRRRQRQQLQST